jgi:deoxyribodipyrimidine photo-lyase
VSQADSQLSALLHQRVSALNQAPENQRGEFVLLWLQGQRRLGQNLAFSHAQRRANELSVPLVVYEGLRSNYPHASDRFHKFVLEGVADNARDAEARGVRYGFFLETKEAPRGVLHQLAARSAVAITDWLPHFIHPAQTKAWAAKSTVRIEAVDAAGVAPLAISDKPEIGARTLRPKITKRLAELLVHIPEPHAKSAATSRFDWGFDPFHAESDAAIDRAIAETPIDHAVRPISELRGGTGSGKKQLAHFLKHELKGYAEERNEPSTGRTSRLSPFLHFGHLGPVEIALAAKNAAVPEADLASFLEELIVRRELAFNFCARVPNHESVDALPGWATQTLFKHASDPRPALLTDQQLENSLTPDPIWNAAQRQLVAEGRIHGYLRMLWGKLMLLWSPDAKDVLRRMRWLNDKYALDGRDSNSDSNFLWCLGLHDRPFPERAIFGTVRSMTSKSTMNKFDMDGYLERWGDRRTDLSLG